MILLLFRNTDTDNYIQKPLMCSAKISIIPVNNLNTLKTPE